MFELALLRDGEVARVYIVGASAVLVGRGGGNDIQTPNLSVSWQHAMFFVEAGRVWVRDLGSSNGTRVNDMLVVSAALNPGDRLQLGEVTFVLVASA